MMLTLPKIVQLEPKRYVAVRQQVEMPFGDEIPPALDELFAHLMWSVHLETEVSLSSTTESICQSWKSNAG
ncbi:hypothetical protein [Asticcacaulis sp.]|uniref:hypothetical protein n=1 Tax=Asticcacaulis sp. TaxID=1872648 RepID=UPI0026204878|nr:hypothetical protein [Asticcacaulis sp.]